MPYKTLVKNICHAHDLFFRPVDIDIFGYFGVRMAQKSADRVHIDASVKQFGCEIMPATVGIEGRYARKFCYFLTAPP